MTRRPKIMRYYNYLAIFILILDQSVKWFQSQFYTQHTFALCKPFCGVNYNIVFYLKYNSSKESSISKIIAVLRTAPCKISTTSMSGDSNLCIRPGLHGKKYSL